MKSAPATGHVTAHGAGRWARPLAVLAIATLALVAGAAQAVSDPVDRVDPFIGTDGTGHTFPGPSRPFGMVQPGPDNVGGGWSYTSGYQYRAPRIQGFSQNRASGTGIPELGDVLLQPWGSAHVGDFSSRYDKAGETARPGYYAVRLTDAGVRVELTSGLRVAMHRWTFDRPGRVYVLVDLQHGLEFNTHDRVSAAQAKVGPDRVEGVIVQRNWASRTTAFSVAFDHPIAQTVRLPAAAGERAPRYRLAFDLGAGRRLTAKAALSNTDVPGARRNLAEAPGFGFDALEAGSRAAWNTLLSRVRIEAPPAQARVFYTALYHAFLHPSVISDADGRWRGPDGAIRNAGAHLRYSTISLWDAFRAAWPLDTILAPERIDDMVASLLDGSDAQGYLPMWPIWGAETNTMIGNPAIPAITEAWTEGFRGFDGARALDAEVASATHDHPGSQWAVYDRFGYYPFDKVDGEAVSRTLEAAVDDDALARMARALGRQDVADRFGKRAQAWTALIDPQTRLARGRDSRGAWRTPFDPVKPTSPLNNPGDYTEANAWQYTWTPALADPEGLVRALGGRPAFTAMLDTFFSLPPTKGAEYLGQEAMIGQYAHGNEPDHHVEWLYAYSDAPWRGQALVRRTARTIYTDAPDGIKGNEDAGQMSAWYVFATLGFYPVEPASGRYVLGAPLVARATLAAPGGGALTIQAPGSSDAAPYAARATLDGVSTGRDVAYAALRHGGVLRFDMRPAP